MAALTCPDTSAPMGKRLPTRLNSLLVNAVGRSQYFGYSSVVGNVLLIWQPLRKGWAGEVQPSAVPRANEPMHAEIQTNLEVLFCSKTTHWGTCDLHYAIGKFSHTDPMNASS